MFCARRRCPARLGPVSVLQWLWHGGICPHTSTRQDACPRQGIQQQADQGCVCAECVLGCLSRLGRSSLPEATMEQLNPRSAGRPAFLLTGGRKQRQAAALDRALRWAERRAASQAAYRAGRDVLLLLTPARRGGRTRSSSRRPGRRWARPPTWRRRSSRPRAARRTTARARTCGAVA